VSADDETPSGPAPARPRSRHVFSGYSTEWPAAFRREAEILRAVLGANLVDIHHIGSTSVPGLAAKATIDILPLVRSLDEVDASNARMAGAGYRAWGEFGLARRRYFTKDRGDVRTHNLHCYRADDPEAERHLAFCAYLRAHPDACREYAALKRAVFARHADDMLAYNDGKNDWIKAREPIAIAWYRARGPLLA
jgi:GrpB-like predicted nucleotidyltransferase (UPF0157 family)